MMKDDGSITNAELLADIALTEREAEAYRMLSEGYAQLARLNAGYNSRLNAQKYFNLNDEARTLLGKLNKIKTERGL
jgi:hypothetical protein